MADKRDYYEVLGVNKNATDDEIKRAYRKKAKECHPDLHPDDKGAVERFKELNEANEVLSDPDKRARYDRYGFEDPMAGMGGENPFSGGFGFGMGDIFDQLFNGGMGSRTTRNQGPVQGNDLRYELRITFEEAAKGCEKSFEIFRNELCETCKGSGAKPGTSPVTCTSCKGTGQIRQSSGWMTTVRTCPVCGGSGKMVKEKCSSCGGTGRTRKKRTVTVKIPAGIDDGQSIRIREKGEPGINGGPRGDLLVEVRVARHPIFQRQDMNLFSTAPITFAQAALGGPVKISTIDGEIEYKIKAGTQTDTRIRLEGKGVPSIRNKNVRGDHYVTLVVQVPTNLNAEAKEALERFDAACGNRPPVSEGGEKKKKSFMDKLKETFED